MSRPAGFHPPLGLIGPITGVIGIMVNADANRRRAAGERRRMLRESKRGR